MLKRAFWLLATCAAASSSFGASPVIISEFMANNNTSISDVDGSKEDWIEIYNTTTTNVNLNGWFLTDATNNLRKWQFPATNLAANGYMLVFASDKNRRVPGAQLHTNFKLNNDGEYLALVFPDGTNIATEFRPVFPLQAADVSYGYATDARDVVLVETNAPARAIVPTADLALLWTENTFNDSTWTNGTLGVGYDRNPSGVDYLPLIGLNVEAGMFNINQTAYIRVPFVITNAAEVDTLTLTMLYDDGMIAYLNGHEITRDNAPSPSTWNSAAPANRADGTAITPNVFNVTSSRDFLQVGTNILAFHGLNNGVGSSDLLIGARLTARTRPTGLLTLRYFPVPTPGLANNDGVAVLGPLVSEEQHTPATPQTNEAITVTAKIRPSFAPVASAKLRYRAMYGAEVEISMLDDGLHGDGLANDGVFGATIPSGIAAPGQMIRWYIRATDTNSVPTRVPAFAEPLRSPEYLGTIVPIAQTNSLDILHWFVQTPSAADNNAGTRASLYYLGEFYDNVAINLHGQSSAGFPKKSYDIDFHRGYNFRWALGEKRVDDVNLLTTYPDKAQMRNMLAYGTFRDAGTPYHFVVPVRVHQNGTFFSDAHLVENGDDNYLERLGMDKNGALYKMYNTLNAATGEKKTRKFEDMSDLQALINGALLPAGSLRNAYMYDNINLPECINYLAAQTVTGNTDCCHKNYYLYRDTEGTGEWQILPWDVDLSFGRVWSSGPTYWDDVLYANTGLFIGNNNTLMTAIYNTPEMRQMYLRRVRTLMEELLQPPGTPASQGKYEQQVDQWVAKMAPDAALDLTKWGTWCCSSAGPFTQASIPVAANYQTMQQAADKIKSEYLPARRTYLFTSQLVGNGGEIPTAQPANASIAITAIEYSPTSGNQAQEYIELRNTNSFALDISRWRLAGGIDFTFAPGTVMSANSYIYVSPNVRAFRSRTAGPRGGQGLFVQGPYQGQLSARGETVRVEDPTGRIVANVTYPPTPSLAQQYLRITELMYHPSPLPGNTNSQEEFEYIELRNIGPVALDLTNVRFTNGVSFTFSGSAVTTLAPGASVLVVKNAALFALRYGGGFPIAGQYEGSLENAGERVELIDAVGEEILDFSYNNSWYPLTDGLGFSLVVRNQAAEPDLWDSKTNWRVSSALQGSPGAVDPAPPLFAPVLITEALTRTTGVPDAIELFNPNNANVDISGWFLTDDLLAPRKYRIAEGTIMAQGSYRVFTESNFNANAASPLSFALSSDGDEVYLFAADLSGNLTGYYHGFSFGAAEEGVSFGRYVSSDGNEQFVPQSSVTLGAANAGPKVGPVVISEIMYHPAGAGTNDNTADEFVELINISANAVSLFDAARPTNTWKLSGGVDFAFPTNLSLAPGEALLVANVATTNAAAMAAFRSAYGLGAGTRVIGAYSGKLNNDGDTISLRIPTAPVTNQGVITIPYAFADRIDFGDFTPWPQAADGYGFSMQRWSLADFGNDPANWVAGRHSAGAPTPTNGVPPKVVTQPITQAVIAGNPVTLSVSVTGSDPLTYQWRLNGTNVLGATNSSLQITNAQPQHAGVYDVTVFNSVGATFSEKATLTVRVSIALLQHPLQTEARVFPDPIAAASTNVTFTVQASSIAPIVYQWRRNGTNIPNATNASYTVTGVTTNDLSYFSVTASDDISSAESTNAWLYPLVSPNFVETPIAQTVVVGGQVSLSVSANGFPPPFTFEWRIGSAVIASNVTDQPYSIYNFTASPTPGTVSYRAVVRNRALPSGRATAVTAVTTLADGDGDGIPDDWETRYGFNAGSAADRSADSDGDGMTNWEEYQAGTDPTNALSLLKFESMIWTNGSLRLSYQSMSNRTYAAQVSSSLSGTNWQTLERRVATRSNKIDFVTDAQATTNRFYRIVTPAP